MQCPRIITGVIRRHPTIFPKHERLRTSSHAAHREVAHFGHELFTEIDNEITHPFAASACGVFSLRHHSGQGIPHRPQSFHRPGHVLSISQGMPDRRKVSCTHLVSCRDLLHGGPRIACGGAMFEMPRRHEVVRIIQRLPLIKFHDALHTEFIPIRFGDDRMRCEFKTFRFQHEVLRDLPGCGEMFRQQCGWHRQGFAGIVEARFVGWIDRKLPRRADVHAGQIADGVIILGITQAPGRHGTRITRMTLRLIPAHGCAPFQDLLPQFCRQMLIGIFRRHLIGLQPVNHQFPSAKTPGHRLRSCVRPEVQFCFLFVLSMTSKAVSLQRRLHHLLEPLRQPG